MIIEDRISMYLNETNDSVTKYINAIKNKEKKRYAQDLKKWFDKDQKGKKPDSTDYNLSYMGAQAVRLHLEKLGLEET